MNNDFELISKKVVDHRYMLASRLIQMRQHEPNEQEINIQSEFFRYLGESLVSSINEAHEKATVWLTLFLQMDNSFFFSSHYYHTVLLEFLEEEVNKCTIRSEMLVSVIKKASDFIHYASSFFPNITYEKIQDKTRKFPLPIEDERITLKELSDLKNALKEATILVITDCDDIIRYANNKFCNITKYSSDELIGNNHHTLLNSGYHQQEFFEEIRIAIKNGRVWKGEICNKAKDGSLYWVDVTIIPFLNNMGDTYQHISIQHDITEQKTTEEMLRKTEKLSLVGELAAGIAHEIRNPLTTIRGFVQILDHFSEEKKFLYSKTILEEIDRINFIVSEFMVFARPHAVYYQQIDLVKTLYGVVKLLGAEAAMKNVNIDGYYEEKEIYIFGEKNQLTQVFLNLLKNAMDALPFGGNIQTCILSDKEKVTVSISDNGMGMTKEQIARIGEPFYTTKDNGNGLGLMVSYKIIENHRGNITVESELNKGTTFTMTFPNVHKK